MPNTFKDFIKLHPNYIVTDINNQGLCNEDDYVYNVYYIKLQTDKYSNVNWSKHCSVSIRSFDLSDAEVIDCMYSEYNDLFG